MESLTDVITHEELILTIQCQLAEYCVGGLPVFGEVELEGDKLRVTYSINTMQVLEMPVPSDFEYTFKEFTRRELAFFYLGLYVDLFKQGLCKIDNLKANTS